MSNRKVNQYGGIGERKSKDGTQWYQHARIYDVEGLSPTLTASHSNHWIIIFKEKK